MKVLVTGATGFVGMAIVQRLASQGHCVTGLHRRKVSSPNVPTVRHVEWRQCDMSNPKALAEAMRGVDAVIHLVGIISEARKITFESVHVCGTRNVIDAMNVAGVKRLLHMSALGTRPQAASRYHQTKWQAEESVRSSGRVWTIFRPSLIFGPGDHFINMFARMIAFSPVLPVIGRSDARFAPVHVNVVADAFVRALANPAAEYQTFDLCGPREMTLHEILEAILLCKGRRRLITHIPAFVAKAQAAIIEVLFGKILGVPPPLNRDQLIMLDEGNTGSGSVADAMLHLEHPLFDLALRDQLARQGKPPGNP